MRILYLILVIVFLFGCTNQETVYNRLDSIPSDAVKITPQVDFYPPILHSSEWYAPAPLTSTINSAGAEDSPFISSDGNTFYFFFTPDVRVPVEKQVIDNVTGIYWSKKINGSWSTPERIILQDKGKLSLDGCEFIQGNKMWFCSAREGYTGLHWFTAELKNGKWENWQSEPFKDEYEVGELHITSDGQELYFHSSRVGGKGGYDMWVSENLGGQWQEPTNIEIVNTGDNEGWPFINEDKTELWFTRFYLGSPAVFRSKSINGSWSEPELIVSQFAGEPTLDNQGNLYFVHHFYDNGTMLEADIYVAYKK
ncbi:MAG: hypothetical protein ABH842_06340 [Candidatus Micrarchaeota archaeon]